MKLEESFAQLEEVIARLENRETSLEDAFKEYQAGLKIIKECTESLDKVEKDMIVLQAESADEKE